MLSVPQQNMQGFNVATGFGTLTYFLLMAAHTAYSTKTLYDTVLEKKLKPYSMKELMENDGTGRSYTSLDCQCKPDGTFKSIKRTLQDGKTDETTINSLVTKFTTNLWKYLVAIAPLKTKDKAQHDKLMEAAQPEIKKWHTCITDVLTVVCCDASTKKSLGELIALKAKDTYERVTKEAGPRKTKMDEACQKQDEVDKLELEPLKNQS